MTEERKKYRLEQTIKNRLDFGFFQLNRDDIARFLGEMDMAGLEEMSGKSRSDIRNAISCFQENLDKMNSIVSDADYHFSSNQYC